MNRADREVLSVSTTAERRRKRKEIRLIQSHSSWLQKALFALQKADAVRDKISDARGEDEAGPFVLEHNGSDFSVEEFEEALEGRIQELLTTTRERRRAMR